MARLGRPRLGTDLIERQRLFAALDAGLEVPLTLLSAPAGSGKTALLLTWLARREGQLRIAWLSLPDPRVFWAAVAASVADALERPSLTKRGETPLEGLLRTFAELDEPLVLVVDDFHHVRAAGVLDPLAKIIARAPEHLHVVLACRRDPDMTLHRLRLGGMMAELRAREMAFTEEEAGAFLEAAGVDLRPELTTALVDRTEGWAAALRFAAMSLRERANAEPFVRALARTEQAVSDYLVSEVLAAQPTRLRDFLLRTSLCERIDGDLADALTGGSDGSRTLAALERDNVFVELQQDGRWYRYHPLFAELLATEARHELGDETLELHRIAARRLAGSGDRLAALRHAVASGDPALASELVAGLWMELIGWGELDLVGELLDRVGGRAIRRNPHLCLLAGWSRVSAGDPEEAAGWVALAGTAAAKLGEEERPAFELGRNAVDLLRVKLAGDLDQVERLTALLVRPEALVQTPREGAARRAFVLWARGVVAAWRGELGPATTSLEAAVDLARRATLRDLELDATGLLALVSAIRGELKRAARLAKFATAFADPRANPRAHVVPALVALALCELEWNDPEAAREYTRQATEVAAASGDTLGWVAAATIAAWVLVQDPSSVDEARVELAGLAHAEAVPPLVEPALRALRARIALAGGDVATARAVVAVDPASAESQVVLARVELTEGRLDTAIEALDRACAGPTPTAYARTHVEAAVLRSVAAERAGDGEAARAWIELALDLAEPEKVRRPFLDAGPTVATVLRRAIRAGSAHRWLAGSLLGVLDGRARDGGTSPPELLEPLSEKERVVLRYLPTLMSNQEIAGELFVSVNTVKTHLKSIYRKLDTSNRREAVRRARELRMIG